MATQDVDALNKVDCCRPLVADRIFRTWTFWIRTHLHDECSAYLETVKLREMRAAHGNERAAAVFRDLGDGVTEVVVMSIWESMDMIERYVGADPLLQPKIDREDRRKLFDREPVVRHEVITDEDVFSLMPAEWC